MLLLTRIEKNDVCGWREREKENTNNRAKSKLFYA
jgi:hypothetical protein